MLLNLNVTVGTTIGVHVRADNTINAICEDYNVVAKAEGLKAYTASSRFDGECTIVGSFDTTMGKFTTYQKDQTVIMEYDTFLDWSLDYLTPKPPQDFKVYVS